MSATAEPRPARPAAENDWAFAHVSRLLDSYARLTGRPLYGGDETGAALAEAVYRADFVLVSHGIEADPLFNYANLAAQRLFELPWERFMLTPSRESAEPQRREAREQLMQRVKTAGYVDDYSGVRIASSGRRFTIAGATVWNVADHRGALLGQAASFGTWHDA